MDEAACALMMAYDQGSDVEADVGERGAPDTERQDYRREAARIAIVLDILRQG